MRHYRCLSTLCLLALLSAAAPFACGARTPLDFAEPCYAEGEIRNCTNTCGTGSQLCTDGYWQPCEVGRTQVPCANDCGDGLAWCENDQLETCVVEETYESCKNDCGEGRRWCIDNAWGDCEVEPVTQSCVNDCGEGILTCEDGNWSDCAVPPLKEVCRSVCGEGTKLCADGVWNACDAPQPLPPRLQAVIRDFKIEHPDFEREDRPGSYYDIGIIEPELGPDDLPVYAHSGPTETVTSRESFDQWYRDVPGVNITSTLELQLTHSATEPGMFVYENTSFFPIDGQFWGNEGLPHNYHFTMAVATEFLYVGRETFSFEGDDDMWVFINRRLAIDLGGLHEAQFADVDLDARAAELGIVPGNTYSLHFFFAERKTVASDFTIHTTIADVGSCP